MENLLTRDQIVELAYAMDLESRQLRGDCRISDIKNLMRWGLVEMSTCVDITATVTALGVLVSEACRLSAVQQQKAMHQEITGQQHLQHVLNSLFGGSVLIGPITGTLEGGIHPEGPDGTTPEEDELATETTAPKAEGEINGRFGPGHAIPEPTPAERLVLIADEIEALREEAYGLLDAEGRTYAKDGNDWPALLENVVSRTSSRGITLRQSAVGVHSRA